MKKVCFVTATRAEYGQIAPVMHKMKDSEDIILQILVTGAHLAENYGYTYQEIEADGFTIDEKVEIQVSTDTKVGICKTMGLAMIGISDALNRLAPNMIVILGDRYEMLSVASVATIMDIPIAHISGGDSTPNAVDDVIRHSITKMSMLHFAFTEQYRSRIIQMGEAPKRVFNVGALGVENAKKIRCMSRSEVSNRLGMDISNKYILMTFHPTTRNYGTAKNEIESILAALEEYREYNYVFTKANSDPEGGIINSIIGKFVNQHPDKAILVDSLGTELYMNVMRYSDIVMGNSSSIIVEAPSFRVPIINIGNRQKGRLKSNAVVDCKAEKGDICNAIEYVLTDEYRKKMSMSTNPFEGNSTSMIIVNEIKKFLNEENISCRKEFYDYAK